MENYAEELLEYMQKYKKLLEDYNDLSEYTKTAIKNFDILQETYMNSIDITKRMN